MELIKAYGAFAVGNWLAWYVYVTHYSLTTPRRQQLKMNALEVSVSCQEREGAYWGT